MSWPRNRRSAYRRAMGAQSARERPQWRMKTAARMTAHSGMSLSAPVTAGAHQHREQE